MRKKELRFNDRRRKQADKMITDAQVLTLALAVVIPLSLLIYSNSRITDAKETLRAELGETKQTLRSEMALGFERISNKVDHLAGEVATLKELMSTHMREHHNR
jgi:hypothetical protein